MSQPYPSKLEQTNDEAAVASFKRVKELLETYSNVFTTFDEAIDYLDRRIKETEEQLNG